MTFESCSDGNTPKARLRIAFAEFMRYHLGDELDYAPTWPGTLRHSMGFVMPQTPYTDHVENGATYKKPAVSLRLVVVSPPYDFDQRHDWLDYHADVLCTEIQKAAKIGVWNMPRVLTTETALLGSSAELLATNINLSPIVTSLEV